MAKQVKSREKKPLIGVVGAGQIGSGIAHVAALVGYPVLMTDIDERSLKRGIEMISVNLDRQIKAGLVNVEAKPQILARISTSTYLRDHRKVDVVIEAAVEIFQIKAEIFRQLDSLCSSEIVFASTTSSTSITKLAAETSRPQRIIGMHFMNPVPVMQLVEVIRGLETDDATYKSIVELAQGLGKTPVSCNDFPGFVSNRVLIPMINEAIFTVYENVATAEAVDEIMKLGMNHPMGPLHLADLIGLDTCLVVMRILQEGMGDPKYRPCPLLVKMVEGGRLGRKTGRGFFDYNGD